MNPFELAHAELTTASDGESVMAAIDALLHDGLIVGEKRYRLFGARIGRAFSMSLGLPLLGGGTPVLRGRVRDGAGPATLDVRVGARYELVVFTGFWGLLTLVGGSYQVLLQIRRVLAGEAAWSAVVEVLPGIALMATFVLLGVGLWRRRQRPQAEALLQQLRRHIEASSPDAPPAWGSAEPID